ncbi:MAG: TrkH family potassium uptake protein [Oscillospiraceae bacterium]|nr:TrkH family potassium uptake protein [Oscillospiraceae bacterium]
MNYRMILYLTGKIMLIGGGVLLLPLAVSFIYGDGCHWAFLASMGIFMLCGIPAFFKPKKTELFSREGMIIVSLSWILFSLIGGLPFFLSGEIHSFIDCFFETVSGFTTTGSTILRDVEHMSKSLLFWRSFTHWIGGMGVLVFAMAIFSQRDARTTYIMRAEMPGPKIGKLVSKWQFSIRILYGIYIALSALEFILLLFGGMSVFDSLVHTFGTAGTGGFGVRNASIGYYNSAYIDYVIGIFMVLFGVNFNVYYLLTARKFLQAAKSDELRIYLGIIAASTLLIALNIMKMCSGFAEAFRYSFFQVASIITTTGYATADFNMWPVFSQMILVFLMFIGACAGSTGGGIKIIRVMILVKSALRELKKTISPRSVVSIKSDGKALDKEAISGVGAYFIVYMLVMFFSILIVSLDNADFTTTVTSVIATLNNIGPGLGAVGPAGNFAGFSALSKLVLSVDMLAGRLELYPILILFTSSVWKKS